MSLVSVVIPCYNAAQFLDDTMASVAAQSGIDWELIIVDDGSTDSSRDLINAWQGRLGGRMRAHFGPNCGVSAARNTGTAMAQGDFIQYLDSDDLLRPHTLQQRVQALAQGADVAYCDWQKLVESNNGHYRPGEVVARKIEDVHARYDIALLTNFWAPPAALLFRRTVVDKIGAWNLTLPVIQDARFLLDAALVGAQFVYVPGTGADYRVQLGNSLSTRSPMRFVLDCFHNACQVEDIWRGRGALDEDQCKALASCYDYTARSLLHGDYAAFRQNIKRLYVVQPGFSVSYPKVASLLCSTIGHRATVFVLTFLKTTDTKIT